MVDVTPETMDNPVASVRRAHSSNLAFAWIMAAVAGAVAISAFSGQSALRLIAPLGIMLTYLYFGINSPGRNTGKLADSIYFLGFLWTLYALINEFVFRHSSVANAESVYRVFGYALVTTAFGMFVRLALLQFHHTASDQIEEAQDDLDIRVEALARELTGAELQLARWRQASIGAMAAFDEELRRAQSGVRSRIEAVHTDAALALANTVKEAVLPLVEELKNITPLTRKMRTAVSTLEKATTASAGGLTDAANTFAEKLAEHVETVDKAVFGNLSRAGATLEAAATNYATTIAKQGDSTVTVLKTTADGSTKLLQLLANIQTTMAQVSIDLVTASERVGELPRDATTASLAIGEARRAGIDRVDSVVNEAAAAIVTAKDAAVALNRTVDEVLDFVRRRMA